MPINDPDEGAVANALGWFGLLVAVGAALEAGVSGLPIWLPAMAAVVFPVTSLVVGLRSSQQVQDRFSGGQA